MISIRKSFALFICLAGARTALAADAGLSATECEIWERERTFAESVRKHDPAAFAEHLVDGAVFGAASPQTQRGREAILKAWGGIIEGKGVTIDWRPQWVSVGKDFNVAMSRGPFAIISWDASGARKYGIGHFVSVWVRKDAASPWRVLLDGGGPAPTPATEDEASKHLATAPTSCPRAG